MDAFTAFNTVAHYETHEGRDYYRMTMDDLDRIEETEQWFQADAILKALMTLSPASRYNPVAVLRSSYAFRGRLSHWVTFLEHTRAYLEADGHDAKFLLRGLSEPIIPQGPQ